MKLYLVAFYFDIVVDGTHAVNVVWSSSSLVVVVGGALTVNLVCCSLLLL